MAILSIMKSAFSDFYEINWSPAFSFVVLAVYTLLHNSPRIFLFAIDSTNLRLSPRDHHGLAHDLVPQSSDANILCRGDAVFVQPWAYILCALCVAGHSEKNIGNSGHLHDTVVFWWFRLEHVVEHGIMYCYLVNVWWFWVVVFSICLRRTKTRRAMTEKPHIEEQTEWLAAAA